MFTKLNRPTALALAAVALIFGALGPWMSVFGLTAAPSDFLQVGSIVFGGIVIVILSALTGYFMRVVALVVGLAILSEVVYVWLVLSESRTNEFVSLGWGLYLSTLTGLFLIASPWLVKR